MRAGEKVQGLTHILGVQLRLVQSLAPEGSPECYWGIEADTSIISAVALEALENPSNLVV